MIDVATDWHTHSSMSDGADSPALMARAAHDAGLTGWGLSDHVRSDTAWLPEYVQTVRGIQIDGLQIRCGAEVKMMDAAGSLDLPSHLPVLDYLLIADHQFPGVHGPQHPDRVRELIDSGDLTAPQAIELLVTATAQAIRSSPLPAIVAHLFSLLPKCGLDEIDVPEDLLDELASSCIAHDAAVEINEKWRCPSGRVLAGLSSRGVRLTAGSDAHRTADVGRWAYLNEMNAAL